MHRDFRYSTRPLLNEAPPSAGRWHPDFPIFDIYVDDPDDAAIIRDLERQRDVARAEAASTKLALDKIAQRMFVKRSQKSASAPPREIEPPKIDDLAREKARRALQRGGFVTTGGKKR